MTNILFLPDAALYTRLVQQIMQDHTIPQLKDRLDKQQQEVPYGQDCTPNAS